jgi:hypothetical protein
MSAGAPGLPRACGAIGGDQTESNRLMSLNGPGLCEYHYRPLVAHWQIHARLSMTHTKIKYFLDSSVVFH